MKKLMILLVTLILIMATALSMAGCVQLSEEDGMRDLATAYANSVRDSEIYQFQEKVYTKATQDREGSVINRRVNVNCAVDKHYNILKDKDFAINIHEDKYTESIDMTSKITSNIVAYNDIMLTKTDIGALSRKGVDSLIVGTGKVESKKMNSSGSIQADVDAKAFYNSEYFGKYKLMNRQVMVELKTIIDDPTLIDFDIPKGGIEKKGKTTDYTFKVSDKYLDNYLSSEGKASIFDGKYVWVQTSYDRIANIYVYAEEKLGGLSAEYEKYIFMVTYLGPHITAPKEIATADSGYEVKGNMFEDGVFDESVLHSTIS